MPAEEKNRTKPEQNKCKRVVDPLHAMIVWFRSGFFVKKNYGDVSTCAIIIFRGRIWLGRIQESKA